MLRTTITSLGTSLRASHYNISNSAVNVQSVRWRKPISLGTAKSKIFKVPPRRKEDPEERAELMRLNKNYKTNMRSLMVYFREENKQREKTSSADHFILTPEEQATDKSRREALNDEWNADCANIRAIRLEKEDAKRREFILERLALKEQRDAERLELADNMVLFEKEQSKTFIRREQIDAAIEDALANPSDFNFAIDLDGNIHTGRYTEITSPEKPALGQKQTPLLAEKRN